MGVLGRRRAQPRKLPEGVQDGRVRWAHTVKYIACHHHEVGRERDHLINRVTERRRNVQLTLIATQLGQPLILAEAQMQIREVYEAHSFERLRTEVRRRRTDSHPTAHGWAMAPSPVMARKAPCDETAP